MSKLSPRVKAVIRNIIILVLCALAVFLYIKIKAWTTNESTGRLTSSGESRSYLLYVPDSYRRRTPTALVIALHGYASKPSDIEFTSRWNDLADQEGFIVVYPSASFSPKRWRSSVSGSPEKSTLLDVQYISDLIDHLETKFNIDPNRVYVNGISQGGGMTYVIACQLADRVAAVGSVAGAYTYQFAQCKPSRPMPVIAFHGDEDPIVPYLGAGSTGYYFTLLPAPDWAAWWAEHNRCSETSTVSQASEVDRTDYQDCDDGADVVFYTIFGGGHTWPGDPSSTDSPEWGYTTHQIDATALMWEFFKEHPLSTP